MFYTFFKHAISKHKSHLETIVLYLQIKLLRLLKADEA